MTAVSFTVLGNPAPQGSKRHVGRGIMVESSKAVRPWRDTIAWTARHAMGSQPMITGAVNLDVTFRVARPKAHYRSGAYVADLKPGAPTWSPKKPDIDKLLRAVLDALTTAGVWADDSQVATLHSRKLYTRPGDQPGCDITVQPLPEGDPQ